MIWKNVLQHQDTQSLSWTDIVDENFKGGQDSSRIVSSVISKNIIILYLTLSSEMWNIYWYVTKSTSCIEIGIADSQK